MADAKATAPTDEAAIPRVLPRGRHNLDDSVVKASQRLRLLEAITEVCGERGYAEMSVADVIERSGVSRKTFYEHFANKEECFIAAYQEGLDRLQAQMGAAIAEASDWNGRLVAAVSSFLESLASTPAFTRLYAVEALSSGSTIRHERDARFERYMDFYRELYRQAYADDPSLSPPDDEVLTIAIGGIAELVRRTVSIDGPEQLPELRDAVVRAVYQLVIGGEAPQ